MRKTLTDKGVAAIKPRATRFAYPDPQLAGHYVRVTPNGTKSFACVCRDPNGRQIWTTLGATDRMTVAAARELAREAIGRVRAGLPAFELRKESFGAVVSSWLTRHVEKNGLRTRKEIERVLGKHVLPAWHDRELVSIKRSDITALLDKLEDNHGARQADVALTIISSIMRWHAQRVDDFSVPIVRGMRRQSAHSLARSRVLSDDEIRAVWRAAEGESDATYGALIRFALLTAQRREKVSTLRWDDVKEGVWGIQREPREKTNAGVLVLPDAAREIIAAQPRLGTNPYVFAGRGDCPISGFSKLKERFDARQAGVEPWRFHDLRRTARSLMSRAGVSSDHAERVLGHVRGGVEGIYDRHAYQDEKADALRRLAALIESIINPSDNVVTLARRRKRR